MLQRLFGYIGEIFAVTAQQKPSFVLPSFRNADVWRAEIWGSVVPASAV